MTTSPRAGFSAFELGLVLLMIGAAMGVVCLLNDYATDRSRMISCGSNVSQLALAMHLYAADYGGRGPAAHVPQVLYPYVKNDQIMLCPGHGETVTVPRNPWAEDSDEPEPPSEDDRYGYGDQARTGEMKIAYQFRAGFWTDDPPDDIIVQDMIPDAHRGDMWVGARTDGAARVYPADKWRPLE